MWDTSAILAISLMVSFFIIFPFQLFDTTPRVFYVSEFGWVASVVFLRILQATLTSQDERSFRCRRAWLAPAFGVPLLVFYCTFGDILSNLIWCGMGIGEILSLADRVVELLLHGSGLHGLEEPAPPWRTCSVPGSAKIFSSRTGSRRHFTCC